MLEASIATDRSRRRTRPQVSDLAVGRAANQLQRQFPESSWLEASCRADRAYVAGHMYHFRLWGRVAQALRDCGGDGLAAPN